MVWDELDRRVKEKQPTSAQHMWELLQDYWKSIPCEAGWENAKGVQSCHQVEGYLIQNSNMKYILICLTLFLVTTWFHMCYFIVLMSSLLFYNVENSKTKGYYVFLLKCSSQREEGGHCTTREPIYSSSPKFGHTYSFQGFFLIVLLFSTL